LIVAQDYWFHIEFTTEIHDFFVNAKTTQIKNHQLFEKGGLKALIMQDAKQSYKYKVFSNRRDRVNGKLELQTLCIDVEEKQNEMGIWGLATRKIF